MNNINMKIMAKKTVVLDTLRKNREEHQVMVKEARAGYLEKARAALGAKLDELASGKISALSFGLEMPVDCTAQYDTAILMLELEQGDCVELDSTLVKCFVENKWDWLEYFVHSNIGYSKTVADKYGK